MKKTVRDIQRRYRSIHARYSTYFPADLWAFLLIILMLIVGILYISAS
jgi:hypothetical protein